MNIKIKAILTVAVFFGTMIGMVWILTKIPEKLLIDIFLGILAIGCTAFAYWVALDYYKGVEELKRLEQKNKEYDLQEDIKSHWYDSNEVIKPSTSTKKRKGYK